MARCLRRCFLGGATVVAAERTQKEKVAEEKPGATRLSLSAAFLCAAGGRAVAYRVCALPPPPPLGGESDKDRRPDDKSFMVLRPHVDGGRRRT